MNYVYLRNSLYDYYFNIISQNLKICFTLTSFLLLVSHMVTVPLLSPLSQFGLFRQPQTSFTRSRNRESFTTLRRVSPRIEARRIRRKIMLTSSLGEIAPRREGAILFEEIGNSNCCHIFLKEYEASCKRMTRAFCKSRKSRKGLFS